MIKQQNQENKTAIEALQLLFENEVDQVNTIGYIDLIADCVITDNQERWKEIFKRWMVTAVANLYEPVTKRLLHLQGEQGIGKTGFIYFLKPAPEYFTYTIPDYNKGFLWRISQSLIVSFDDAINKSDFNTIRKAISTRTVGIKKPYHEYEETHCIFSSFISSGNIPFSKVPEFIDVVNVNDIDQNYVHHDIISAWGEAYTLYQQGYLKQ